MFIPTIFVGAYLIGSLSFAVIVSRLMGIKDPRSYGSGNPGATNVLRSGKKIAAALTLLGDALKGWFAVSLTYYLSAHFNLTMDGVAVAAVAVLIGHMWPIFFNFTGGKGVATALGVLLALNPYLALIALLVWLFVFLIFRISSLAALAASISMPLAAAYFYGIRHSYFYSCLLISCLVIYRHRRNIQNLITGKEAKIGQKTA